MLFPLASPRIPGPGICAPYPFFFHRTTTNSDRSGGVCFFILILFFAAFVCDCECQDVCRRDSLSAFKLQASSFTLHASSFSASCTGLGMVPIHIHRTSAREPKKCPPFIYYSFAHGVAQPLLQRRKNKSKEVAKITSTDKSTCLSWMGLRVITGSAYDV